VESTAKNRSVLIVDDEEHVREALERVLEKQGYAVFTAADGEEALRILQARAIQLLITDHDMPGMKGVELLKQVRESHPHVCRILLTGNADRETVVRSINEGEVYRVILKPWDNVLLRVTLHFAFEAIEIEGQNRRLIAVLRRQMQFMRELEEQFPLAVKEGERAELAAVLAEAELMRPQEVMVPP
jgi:two-component system NtrC family sensor kinase